MPRPLSFIEKQWSPNSVILLESRIDCIDSSDKRVSLKQYDGILVTVSDKLTPVRNVPSNSC